MTSYVLAPPDTVCPCCGARNDWLGAEWERIRADGSLWLIRDDGWPLFCLRAVCDVCAFTFAAVEILEAA